MPTYFLDLPREIRDIIYRLVLISPTGHVTPIADKTSRNPRFLLHAAPYDERKRPGTTEWQQLNPSSKDILSLSFPRTCKQVWHETRGMFWSQNTFTFENPKSMTQALKSMGQTASRRIESVSFSFGIRNDHWRGLPKALASLASRARHGSLRKLHLDLSSPDFRIIRGWKIYSDPFVDERSPYDELLRALRVGAQECNDVERSVWVIACDAITIRDLHLAFGGKIYNHGRLEWDDYRRVGQSSRA